MSLPLPTPPAYIGGKLHGTPPSPRLMRPDSRSPRLRKHKRTHGDAQGPQKTRLAVRKGPQIAYSTRRNLECEARITIKLFMQPANWVRRIRCTTHPVNVNRTTWAGHPQVPETPKQAWLVNTPHDRLTPQKLQQRRRIDTKQVRLADTHIEKKFQTPHDSTRLRALLVRRLLKGHR